MFSEAIDRSKKIIIHYNTLYYGLNKTFFLYKKEYVDLTDSSAIPFFESSFTKSNNNVNNSNLNVSGYKSIGVSFGNRGQVNLEQALDIKIFGMVAPETELSANLTDQETSLEGSTREIGELDMIFISLKNPNYKMTLGDQYVSLYKEGLVYEKKKIKGISVGIKKKHISASVYGAVSGGKYAVQQVIARLGFQGPYYLKGNGEPDQIIPISGTVNVFVDGKKLEEGYENDFVVDYDMGTISFTPYFTILDNQSIRFEYEYKMFDYQRLFSGTAVDFSNTDSTVNIRSALWYETDNKKHEIDLPIELDSARAILVNVGDSLPNIMVGRSVDPTHVAGDNSKYHLYKIRDSLGQKIFYYAPYDMSRPLANEGFYIVKFRDVGLYGGDYDIVDTIQPDYRGNVYEYVGAGNGSFTAFSKIPAPQRSVLGEITVDINPKPWFYLKSSFVGEEHDKNIFSDVDDDDNTSAATKSSIEIGEKKYDVKSIWLKGNYLFISEKFTKNIFARYNLFDYWDILPSDNNIGRRNIWESWIGITPVAGVSTEINYGQFIKSDTSFIHRISNHTRLLMNKHLIFNYNGDEFIHYDSQITKKTHRDKFVLSLNFNKIKNNIFINDEWETDTSDIGRGSIKVGSEVNIDKLNLNEKVSYSQSMRGKNLFLSPDTSRSFSWNQNIYHSFIKGWNLSVGSSYLQTILKNNSNFDTVKTTLITVFNEVLSPRIGFSMNQKYSATSEQGSEVVQVVTYAGEGLGSYKYDSLSGEYTEAKFGSFYSYDKEIYDISSDNRVRKINFSGEWSFKPTFKIPAGILSDIRWRGNFAIAEHIKNNNSLSFKSWIPGYLSVSGTNDTLIDYSNLFYRQEAKWNPKPLPSLEVVLNIKDSYRNSRYVKEKLLELGGNISNTWGNFNLITKGTWKKLNNIESYNKQKESGIIRDMNVTLTEELIFLKYLTLFTNETIGRSGMDLYGKYYVVKPGIRIMPKDRGYIETFYAYSNVNLKDIYDYRIAQGYDSGITHTLSFIVDFRIGEHFNASGNYRGEISNATRNSGWKHGIHTFSFEMKAFL